MHDEPRQNSLSKREPQESPGNARRRAALGRHEANSSLLRVATRESLRTGESVSASFFDLEHLIGVLTHEGKNLLGPIRGYASLIQDAACEGSNERRWADKIERTVESMERYFERLGSYRVKGALGVEESSWATILNNAISQCRRRRGFRTRVVVENQAVEPFGQHVELLRRVVFHVIANAFDAAGDDGLVQVRVGETRVAGDDGIVREFTLEVEDDGDGIDANSAEKIFLAHFTTRHDHAGLGLTTVAAAAPALGMDVAVDSKPGEGTRVVLTLRQARRQS